MNIIFLAFLLAMQTAAVHELASPRYPLLAASGGNVVAIVQPNKEYPKVLILSAEEPFAGTVRDALSQWHTDKDIVVVINFQSGLDMENTENGIKLVPTVRRTNCPQKDRRLPIPTMIVDSVLPDPPPEEDVYGSVVIRLRISASGAVQGADIVQGIKEYYQPVIKAVKQWKFLPALHEDGTPVKSEAYGICVYRIPLPGVSLH